MIGVWILLTAFGAFSAGQVSERWLEDFSIPGASGYEADQRALAKLGNGEVYPFVIVVSADEDVTKVPGVEEAIDALSDRLLTHFGYEEEQLVEPLSKHGLYPGQV